jgi:hypothetical protein
VKRGGELPRTPMRSRYRNTGPSEATVEIVWRRDEGRCVVCGDEIIGTRGLSWSVHHRMARKRGGSIRPFINLPGNLLLLHGTGTEGCHGRVEANGLWAREYGFKVREGRWLPAQVLVDHAVHGPVYLADDGSVSGDPPEGRYDSLPEEP